MDVDRIAETAETLAPEALLDAVLGAHENARPCFTSSFQAEDMAVLHLLRKRIPDVPVLFLDTGYHFPQTYEYRDRVAKEWSLNLVNVLPVQTVAEQESAFGILNRSDPTRCCQLRKVEPLLGALEPFDVWFTGLRREQSPTRKIRRRISKYWMPALHRAAGGSEQSKIRPLGWNEARMRHPHIFETDGSVAYPANLVRLCVKSVSVSH